LFPVQAPAQETHKFEVSALISPSTISDGHARKFDVGPSVALNYYWRERLSFEGTLAANKEKFVEFDDRALPPRHETKDSFSLSGAALYNFRRLDRWRPYLGAGLSVTHADTPEDPNDRVALLFEGGVRYLLRPRLSARGDLKVLGITLTGADEIGRDVRGSAGLCWRF